MNKKIDLDLLSQYQPLNSLNPDNLRDIARQLTLEKLPAGQTLFNKGDSAPYQYFLVEGEIELLADQDVLKTIRSGSSDSIYFKIDGELLDVMLTWDQTGNYQVSELGVGHGSSDDDWMSHILQTEAFHRIPPANIQAIFMRMESVPVKAGEEIVSQGDRGDYFYIIKKGRALVTRAMPDQPKGIKLAELKDGDTFGEEALISDATRNATVTMLTDGSLSRLSKQDFLELLNEPLLSWVDYGEAEKMIAEGAQWLDVRLPAEHQANAINGDIHIPLIFLRMKIDTLDMNKSYIVYCDTGRRSSAASFLLNERGYNSYILKDGISSVPEEKRSHPL